MNSLPETLEEHGSLLTRVNWPTKIFNDIISWHLKLTIKLRKGLEVLLTDIQLAVADV